MGVSCSKTTVGHIDEPPPPPTSWQNRTDGREQARTTATQLVAALRRGIGVPRQNAAAERGQPMEQEQ